MSYSCAIERMSSPSIASTVLIRFPFESLKWTLILGSEVSSVLNARQRNAPCPRLGSRYAPMSRDWNTLSAFPSSAHETSNAPGEVCSHRETGLPDLGTLRKALERCGALSGVLESPLGLAAADRDEKTRREACMSSSRISLSARATLMTEPRKRSARGFRSDGKPIRIAHAQIEHASVPIVLCAPSAPAPDVHAMDPTPPSSL